MKTISVTTNSKKYPIYVGEGILTSKTFKEIKNRNIIVVADKKPYELHKSSLRKALKNAKKVDYISLPFSEKNKTVSFAEKVCNKLLDIKADRDVFIVVFGGGVAGDIVGFVASVYMRGVSFIHIPTTLVSQVDSSIGGKTGVNLLHAKNIFGTITQPEAVIIDTAMLNTLPPKQIKEGLAEVVKYGCANSKKLFTFLEKTEDISDKKNLQKIVYESAVIKAKIVSEDERESGLRETLNFGHTVAHALEIHTNHKISHGQAVAIGSAYEAAISKELGYITEDEYAKILALLKKFKLPVRIDCNVSEVIALMKTDKKNKNGETMFVLLGGIGSVVTKNNKYSFPVDTKIIKKCLTR